MTKSFPRVRVGALLQVACDTFCLDMDESLNEASEVLHNEKLTTSTVRFMNSPPDDLPTGEPEIV